LKRQRSASDEIPTQPAKLVKADQRKLADIIAPPPGGEVLPDLVEKTDLDATRVSMAALRSTHIEKAQKKSFFRTLFKFPSVRNNPLGCLFRVLFLLMFVAVLVALAAGSYLIVQYFRITASLPSVDELLANASQFQTTRIFDRDGDLLYEIVDPNAGLRTYVKLNDISPYVILATLATEDKNFYQNPGYDLLAILRALWQNYTAHTIVSGASTITQQLARILLLGPEERNQRSLERKAREIILAGEITKEYSKDQILEIYLNEVYYGNLAYGIEAAAETYFHKSAAELTLGESIFLAGLPQAPSVYDIFTNPDATLHRSFEVLGLVYAAVKEGNGCVNIGPDRPAVCATLDELAAAQDEITNATFQPPQYEMKYPHWVNYIRTLLEQQYGDGTIFRAGLQVYTTLDPQLQDEAQQMVTQQVQSLGDHHVTDGALVAIQPSTGEILAMVGSADFYNDAIAGQINMAVQPRQPGSSIKPLTYCAAFEKGWTPATLIWDVPSKFPPSSDPNDTSPWYEPVNYDNKFHGPVTARTALANSYNVAAVKTLQYVGIYDDPNTPQVDGFLAFAQRMGITTLTQPFYGLSLTLGGGDVTLLELTAAYSIFANGGQRVPPAAILKITDFDGDVIFEYQPQSGAQVIRPEHAYLISSILSDNQARTPMFGANSVLNLPFTVAAKTGTTNDFRDNWTLGYTPDLAVGVWVGNADYTPMENTSGLTGAAPIWSEFMQYAVLYLTNGNPTPFSRPSGIVDEIICSVSGTTPSHWCPSQRSEIFAYDQPPLPAEDDLWKEVKFDTWTGLGASSACGDFVDEIVAANITDPTAIDWIKNTNEGKAWASQMKYPSNLIFAPTRACSADDPHAVINFVGLSDGQVIKGGPLDIYTVVYATANFKSFKLQYGLGANPSSWQTLVDSTTPYQQADKLYSLDISALPSGQLTLHIYMESNKGGYAEKTMRITVQQPTPTPTMTATETSTPTATFTTTAIPSETPTEPFLPSSTPTFTQVPTASNTPTP
jgi:penicillin-binding protein 1C